VWADGEQPFVHFWAAANRPGQSGACLTSDPIIYELGAGT
jgi:hypothetical protein